MGNSLLYSFVSWYRESRERISINRNGYWENAGNLNLNQRSFLLISHTICNRFKTIRQIKGITIPLDETLECSTRWTYMRHHVAFMVQYLWQFQESLFITNPKYSYKEKSLYSLRHLDNFKNCKLLLSHIKVTCIPHSKIDFWGGICNLWTGVHKIWNYSITRLLVFRNHSLIFDRKLQ